MVETRALPADAAESARRAPLGLVSSRLDASVSAYFVDMVKDDLLDRFEERELGENSYRVYTTLDPALEHAAAEAIRAGMAAVDDALARRRTRKQKKGVPPPAPDATPQVALVALDAATGRIRALAGGRDYGSTQLNRVLARRQPGSVFKPFVYAAAFEAGVQDGPPITPLTTVVDEPTTFRYGGEDYAPNNYGQEYYGTVTVREAVTRSLNVATVKVAELVGYRRIVELARRLGIANVQATPSLALGSYEMTPLEVAAAYTVFANRGSRAEPSFVDRVVSQGGDVLELAEPKAQPVLDPRIAYLVDSLLVDVVNRGTGVTVRARGFQGPAAGKTGTSHDGWFAGFTSNLVCVVWVGFDDNRELGLSGSASAAPIWAEFMKRAVASGGYRNPQPFARPPGITTVAIDPETRQVGLEGECPTVVEEVFISGTEPTERCALHSGGFMKLAPISWLSRLFGRKHHAEREAREARSGMTRGRP
jgi:penicillin-binding protein 1B